MNTLPTLDIAICTHRPEGIGRVASMELPRLDGVRYVVSWQSHEGAEMPESLLERDDIDVCRFEGKGLSANRNNALSHCTSELILIADDDLVFYPDGIEALRRAFGDNAEVDLITFRSEGAGTSRFPRESVRLTEPYPKNYSVRSVEIALRRSTAGKLRLCTEFGLGAPRYHCGEEELLLLSAIRRGYNCRFFPITVCSHPRPSTGSSERLSDGSIRAQGAVIAISHPRSWPLRVPLKAWRVSRRGQAGFFRALRYLLSGAFAAGAILQRNHDTLW